MVFLEIPELLKIMALACRAFQPGTMDEWLKKHGIAPNPDADQHFMADEKILKKMVSAAKLKKDEVVLEIGAGIGNLTKLLAKKAKKVYAIEKDAALSTALKEETAEFDNVEIIIADALKFGLPKFDKLVSNLPYQICEALLQKLIFMGFKSAIVCVPEKFAERIIAKKGGKEFSILSIKAQAFFDIEAVAEVPKGAFLPVPRVDSYVVRIAPKKNPDFSDLFVQELFRESDKIVKNAAREALIFACTKKGKDIITKRSAKAAVKKMNLPAEILAKRLVFLDEKEITSIGEKSREVMKIFMRTPT